MPVLQIVRGELRRDAAPAEGEPRAKDRDRAVPAAEHLQPIWEQAEDAKGEQDEQQRLVSGVAAAAGRGGERGASDADHDRDHRDVLPPAGALAQHPLARDHEHEQPGRERGLDDDERREQQRSDLEGPPEQRQAGAEQPAALRDEAAHEREAEVRPGRGLLRVHRLQRNP